MALLGRAGPSFFESSVSRRLLRCNSAIHAIRKEAPGRSPARINDIQDLRWSSWNRERLGIEVEDRLCSWRDIAPVNSGAGDPVAHALPPYRSRVHGFSTEDGSSGGQVS